MYCDTIMATLAESVNGQVLPIFWRCSLTSGVALAGAGGSGGRCGWKLRSREDGSALVQAGMGEGHPGRGGLPH
jgi:hypothetical protein